MKNLIVTIGASTPFGQIRSTEVEMRAWNAKQLILKFSISSANEEDFE